MVVLEHVKTYQSLEMNHKNGNLVIEGPVSSEELEALEFHEDLTAFRPPAQQKKALVEICDRPEGRIIIARHEKQVVGYVTYVYPDPLERWSEGNLENLIELGAIEVVPKFRGGGVGKALLTISTQDDAMEDYIILTTEYYWHWDLKGTGLNVWEYRSIMGKMMTAGGLDYYATDDPEICSHPANCLMARIGKRVDHESVEKFDNLRFKNRFIY